MLRSLLLLLAKSSRLCRFVTRNSFARRCARRFIAGESMSEAIDAVRDLNKEGISATVDFLGEHVTSADGARRVMYTYLTLLDRIAKERFDAHVSLKLSQLGLDVDPRSCVQFLNILVQHAARYDRFVRVDMEGSVYTQHTLDIVQRAHPHCPAVGTVIQAYLYRSSEDVAELLRRGCRIRLCKGAYKESAEVAYQQKNDVDTNFAHLMQRLLQSGGYHAIATHDEKVIKQTIAFATTAGIPANRFEFQMLYGIRRDLQRNLVRRGYRVRVYVPFGNEWFPYFMRRLAERPANLWFLLRNALRL